MAACRKPSEWVPLSILSVPLAGCLLSLDQVSKLILTTSAFRTFVHFLPSTHCGPAIVHENTLRGMRCHGTRHAVGSFAFHWCGWVDRPSLQSEPSTSEDENADLHLFGFYEAAGMGALDHRDVGWTVRCELSSMMSETSTLDPKNLCFMDSDDARKRPNPREPTSCTPYYPGVYSSQTLQSH